ncbi:hypothetical protein [Roseomonas sp. AR75]|uniref:hypothetical protein n=1 Tax=Roseomonas sp. AR75 TaxID=2562311 RepID=UPI00148506F9|nr:hypothetical protein [Roseomonas sp. AR75]
MLDDDVLRRRGGVHADQRIALDERQGDDAAGNGGVDGTHAEGFAILRRRQCHVAGRDIGDDGAGNGAIERREGGVGRDLLLVLADDDQRDGKVRCRHRVALAAMPRPAMALSW